MPTAVPIKGYPNYLVSNDGRFYNRRFQRDLNLYPGSRGELRVALSRAGVKTYFQAHRLVAQAFLPDYDERFQVDFKDGDRHNITASNLIMTMREAH